MKELFIKKFLKTFFLIVVIQLVLCIPSFAYEDCIITTNAKMTEIRIQDHEVIDVYPLITIMNDKNTLIVHPLKTGKTQFSVLKNNKNIILFNVIVREDETIIDDVEGFEILAIDGPPQIYEYELDFPPVLGR